MHSKLLYSRYHLDITLWYISFYHDKYVSLALSTNTANLQGCVSLFSIKLYQLILFYF